MHKSNIKHAFFAAVPYTIPIFAGFTFLGMAYGMYMNASGFSFWYPLFMSIAIFAGSAEFVAVSLLLAPFDPLNAFLMALMINARHLFYGIAMLERYQRLGKKKWYLIYGLCDESFSINYTAVIPDDVDRGWFYFFVTILNQCYWVLGATLGGLFGHLLPISTKGIEFVMTALFLVIFLEQWNQETNHISSYIGLAASLLSLLLFKSKNFMIPAMILILIMVSKAQTNQKEGKIQDDTQPAN